MFGSCRATSLAPTVLWRATAASLLILESSRKDLFSNGPFDAIIFNDVFEHLPDPIDAIVAVERLLADDGILVLNLPSSDGLFFRVSTLLNRLGWRGPYERLWQREDCLLPK